MPRRPSKPAHEPKSGGHQPDGDGPVNPRPPEAPSDAAAAVGKKRRRPGKPAPAIPAAPTLEQYGAGLIKVLQATDCQPTLGDRLLSQYQGDCVSCGATCRMSVHVLDNTRPLNRYAIQCECGQYVSLDHWVVPKT
jgi:hypothetical protein